MTSISIFGANELTKLLIELIREEGQYTVESVVVDDEYWFEGDCQGVPVTRYTSLDGPRSMISAIGYRTMRARRTVFERLVGDGHSLVDFVSRNATLYSSATLGKGNILMPGVIVEPMAEIGDNNLFWSRTLVCHGVRIGDHNYFSAGCILGGESRVGTLCFLGNSVTTIDGVVIADETQVLAGSALYENTEACTRYFGNPARAIGLHRETGIVIER